MLCVFRLSHPGLTLACFSMISNVQALCVQNLSNLLWYVGCLYYLSSTNFTMQILHCRSLLQSTWILEFKSHIACSITTLAALCKQLCSWMHGVLEEMFKAGAAAWCRSLPKLCKGMPAAIRNSDSQPRYWGLQVWLYSGLSGRHVFAFTARVSPNKTRVAGPEPRLRCQKCGAWSQTGS